MIVKPTRRPELSDAQYRTLGQVIARESDTALRFVDTRTVLTLVALGKRGYVTLVWGPVDGRARGIAGAHLTGAGRKVYDRETTRRGEVARYEATMAAARGTATPAAGDEVLLAVVTDTTGTPTVVGTLAERADPFALVATGNGPRCATHQTDIPF